MTVSAASQCEPWNTIWLCPSIYKWNPWSLDKWTCQTGTASLGCRGRVGGDMLMSTEHMLGELKRSVPAAQRWYWPQEIFPRRNRALRSLVLPSYQRQYCIPFHATHSFQLYSVFPCSSPILPSDLHLWSRNEVFCSRLTFTAISWAYLLPQWTAWSESLTWLVLSETLVKINMFFYLGRINLGFINKYTHWNIMKLSQDFLLTSISHDDMVYFYT